MTETMVLDLSYIHEKTTEENEDKIRKAIEKECLKAVRMYLDQLADTMEANNIPAVDIASLRAMSSEMQLRIDSDGSPTE